MRSRLRAVFVAAGVLALAGCTSVASRPDPASAGAGVRDAPRLVETVPAIYPLQLKREGVTGYAIVVFDIGRDGLVSNVRVQEATHALFGLAAVAAVSKWRYRPAFEHSPSHIRTVVTHDFNQRVEFRIKNDDDTGG